MKKQSKAFAKKQLVVAEIVDRLKKSKATIVAEYKGLTVKEFQELRIKLAEKNVEVKVYKNRLFKIAAEKVGIKYNSENLVGQNVYAFGMDDDIAPSKIIVNYSKDHKALIAKTGTYEGKVLSQEDVVEISKLPSYEEALTMLATSLLAPVKYTAVGLNMLVEEGHIKE